MSDPVVATLEQQVAAGLSLADLTVAGEAGKYEVHAIGDCFDGVSRVKRQQMVYACIKDLITAGTVHAVVIKAQTPKEAERG